MKTTRLAALRRVWDRARRIFPFTAAGLLISAASALALFYYGLGRIDLILLGVGAVGLAICASSLVLTVLAAALSYRSLRKLPPSDGSRLECGYWVATGFSIPSLWYLPFVSVTWRWRSPQARVRVKAKRGRAHEEVFPERRGLDSVIERVFDVGDIFGICKITFSARQLGTVRCMPWVGALRQLQVVRGMAKGDDISHPEGPADGDRYDMRHYNAGDPIRFILWKVFAKSRELIIRTPERAISPAKKTAVYMVADTGDEPGAGAARTAIDVDAFGGDWVLGADGSSEVTQSKSKALELLAQSAHVHRDQSGAGLSSFLQEAAAGAMARAVVFLPPVPGPWLDRVAHAVRREGGAKSRRISFVVGIDGLDHRAGQGRLAHLVMSPAPPPDGRTNESPLSVAKLTDLGEIVKKLGNDILIVDRVRGQVFTPTQLRLG